MNQENKNKIAVIGYTKEKFEEYYQHYSECFEGLENLVDVYESRKQK